MTELLHTQPDGFKRVLTSLVAGEDLDAATAEAALMSVFSGDATDAQLAGLLVGLAAKGETVDEVAGMASAMIAAAAPLNVGDDCIDLVGAGGSELGKQAALNVSTMACFVASAAGATVCKHGNRKASSTSGSFDVLEVLGLNIDISPEQVEACIAEAGLGFVFARTFHPAMRFAGPVRAELGIPTVFNKLGPLTHPGRLKRQVIGTPDVEIAELMASVLASRGSVRSMVVSGDGGLDELSTTGPNKVFDIVDGVVSESVIDPGELGFRAPALDELHGGDAEANARLARDLFSGRKGPVHDIVVLNAAAGLVVAGVSDTMAAGVEAAKAAVASGAAALKLEQLKDITNRG